MISRAYTLTIDNNVRLKKYSDIIEILEGRDIMYTTVDDELIMLENLSAFVTEMMKKQKISVKTLAKRTGLSAPVIRNIKEKKVKKLNAHNIVKIAQYFRVSPDEVLGIENAHGKLGITSEYVEFETSFYEKDAGDFTYYKKCQFLDVYDTEYEEAVINGVHSIIEAHKLATNYYYSDFDDAKYRDLTFEKITKNHREWKLEQFLKKYEADETDSDIQLHDNSEDSSRKINNVVETGKTIQRMRKRYGITRKDLADRTGLSVDCVFRIETGKNRNIDYNHINLIARELLCTTDFLIGESCDPTARKDGESYHYLASLGGDIFIFSHVQLGHDLAYAYNHMNEEAQNYVVQTIRYFNTMYDLREISNQDRGERLSIQDVFFREQESYNERRKNRGATFYTKKYYVTE